MTWQWDKGAGILTKGPIMISRLYQLDTQLEKTGRPLPDGPQRCGGIESHYTLGDSIYSANPSSLTCPSTTCRYRHSCLCINHRSRQGPFNMVQSALCKMKKRKSERSKQEPKRRTNACLIWLDFRIEKESLVSERITCYDIHIG